MATGKVSAMKKVWSYVKKPWVGNFLVHRWQLRSWREQQRQLGYQAELEELKALVGEISTKAADRHNAMRRLLGSLAPNSRAETGSALADYQQQVAIWNATLNSFFVRIRLALNRREALSVLVVATGTAFSVAALAPSALRNFSFSSGCSQRVH